ncbi:hypothetical protein COLO4_06669 [Corchorus olitorius]|uniref:Uncharacterized protein n=1 Tax=Corchorus olitorius TaxID=93759 RepID=A0A1R3KMI8_9ROSI|nr:hypothetical protein COLO4_06669 [Corchorus olitorius]
MGQLVRWISKNCGDQQELKKMKSGCVPFPSHLKEQ